MCIRDSYQAGLAHGATAVAKIPSDCPLIDPRIIDRVLGFFLDHPGQYDFVSNLHPASYPDGNDVEVMTMDALAAAWKEATRPLERQHTTPNLWENHIRFRLVTVLWATGRDDTPPRRSTTSRRRARLLYTSGAAGERSSVDLGGRRLI